MSIAVTCQHCGKTLRVNDSLAASLRFCPFCKDEIEVPPAALASRSASAEKRPADPFAKPERASVASSPAGVGPAPSGGSGEGTVYADPEVMVTSARVICRGSAYVLRDVTAAKMETTPANRLLGMLIIAFGAVLAVVAVFISGTDVLDEILAWAGPAVVLGAGIWSLLGDTPDFHVVISNSAGEVRAFTSKNCGRVERIVAAVNDAIVKYR